MRSRFRRAPNADRSAGEGRPARPVRLPSAGDASAFRPWARHGLGLDSWHASAEEYADCIGSRTVDGMHAPLLDLDFQAVLCPEGSALGRTRLLFNRTVEEASLQAVWEELDLCSFGPPLSEIVGGESASLVFTVPVRLLTSRTPGHFHLYIDATTTWERHVRLFEALAETGIIERRFRNMSLRQRMSFLRVPGKR